MPFSSSPSSLSEVKKAVQKAPQSGPAEVGDGVPMAPPAPEKPMAIAVQSAQSPKPTPPTPEQRERAIAKLRENQTRLPKPAGILQQRGPLIEGVYYVPAPPELTEYLRARAGALAAEAAMAAEKGRVGEAVALWGSAAEYLAHLTAFEPTREAIAGCFWPERPSLPYWRPKPPGWVWRRAY
jgi:hypothetical protein